MTSGHGTGHSVESGMVIWATKLLVFDLLLPNYPVRNQLVHGELHRWENVGNSLEKRTREDVHEADLRLAEFDDIIPLGRTAEQLRRDVQLLLHVALVRELVRQYSGPFSSYSELPTLMRVISATR